MNDNIIFYKWTIQCYKSYKTQSIQDKTILGFTWKCNASNVNSDIICAVCIVMYCDVNSTLKTASLQTYITEH